MAGRDSGESGRALGHSLAPSDTGSSKGNRADGSGGPALPPFVPVLEQPERTHAFHKRSQTPNGQRCHTLPALTMGSIVS